MSKSTTAASMEARKRTFLTALAIAGVVTSACETTGVSRKTAYTWRDGDPAFADEWDDALATATDRLETEAHRRAVLGVEEPVFHRGQLVFKRDEKGEIVRDSNGDPIPMTVSKRSDRLLEILLAAKKPTEFGRRQLDVNQKIESAPMRLGSVDFKTLSAEKRALIRQLLNMPDDAFVEDIAQQVDFIDDPTKDAF